MTFRRHQRSWSRGGRTATRRRWSPSRRSTSRAAAPCEREPGPTSRPTRDHGPSGRATAMASVMAMSVTTETPTADLPEPPDGGGRNDWLIGAGLLGITLFAFVALIAAVVV